MGTGSSVMNADSCTPHITSDPENMSRNGQGDSASAALIRGGPDRMSGRSTKSNLSATASSIGSTWRSALLSTTLANSTGRKLRAAALGRKSACTVKIDKDGFSLQHIQICEGQVVQFQWDDPNRKGFNVTQVYRDGDQYKPVVGGFNSGPISPKGFFEQQFNLKGDYKFVSAGLRCTPLTVEVYPRRAIECKVTEEGFEPKMIRIDEGNSVHWKWNADRIPRTIVEMRFNHKTGSLVHKKMDERPIPTKSGDFSREFMKPGLYYFVTEGATTGELNCCMVHVRERQIEYRIEVLDHHFETPLLVIEEGDRVWWHWNKEKCNKMHCVYQVDPPPLNHPLDESYKPKKNGFKHPNPSRDGLISAEFFDPGIFYYSDHNFEEAAEYIGTIIVKPKQVEHFIEMGPDGFSPDLLYANTGDRIWWTWYSDEMDRLFRVMEVEKCISPVGVRNALENENKGEGSYMDEEAEQTKVMVGLETVQLGGVGVYHYRATDSAHSISTCSVITNPGPRNHTVHVTETTFEPKVVTIHPGDRVWWVWQDGTKQHNISQVTHQGKHISGGFCSGAPMDPPSAFMHEFDSLGVFYYTSQSLSKVFGAVVVASHPADVHEIQVTGNAITPDPEPVNINDVVAWTFRGLKQSDVCQIMSVDQLVDAKFNSQAVAPRRCMNRLFTTKGVYHFTSKSFGKSGKREQTEETRLSSVLVDEAMDSDIVRVTSKGFHPEHVTIYKGESVLWQWKDSGDEAHNIIHVNPPNSSAPLSVIQGGESFNSGKPMPNNSFLYTFDEPGTFAVASQGAPGYAGTIHVLAEGRVTSKPHIIAGVNGGTVEKFHQVKLTSDTPNARIYYTIDGTIPAPYKPSAKNVEEKVYFKSILGGSTKVYDPSRGISLKYSGLCFVRAVAVAENKTNSDVFTSKRFWVLSGEENDEDSESDTEQPVQDDNARKLWWNCVPTIKAVFTQPGVMEVFWEPPPEEAKHFIRAYQLFLNGVSYCELFPPVYTTVNVAGLAGGRLYEVVLEAYPTDNMFLPHKSNKLMMKCAQTNSSGGPVISLETTPKRDTLSVVWMSISTKDNPIIGYRVYLNGQMCGNQVMPDESSDRCKVVIEGCQLDLVYRVVVSAVPPDNGTPKMSNELEITLPLDSQHITLPPNETRLDDDDLYKEYIEVRETGDYDMTKDAEAMATHSTAEIFSGFVQNDRQEQEEAGLIDTTHQGYDDYPERYDPYDSSHDALLDEHDVGQDAPADEFQMMEGSEDEEGEMSTADDEGLYGISINGGLEDQPWCDDHDVCNASSPGNEVHVSHEAAEDTGSLGSCGENTSQPSQPSQPSQAGVSGVKSKSTADSQQIKMLAPCRSGLGTPPRSAKPGPVEIAVPQTQLGVSQIPKMNTHVPSTNTPNGNFLGSEHKMDCALGQFPADANMSPMFQTTPVLGNSDAMQAVGYPMQYEQYPYATPHPPQQPQPQLPRHHGNQYNAQQSYLPPYEVTRPPVFPSPTVPVPNRQKPPLPHNQLAEASYHLLDVDVSQCMDDIPVIDATQEPWRNKMKIVSDGVRAMARMSHRSVTGTDSVRSASPCDESMRDYHVEVQDEGSISPRTQAVLDYLAHKDRRKKKRAPHTAVVAVNDSAQETAAPPAVPVVAKDGELPPPEVTVENQGEDALLVSWQFRKQLGPDHKLLVNVVNIVGSKFKKTVNSDISFECMQETDSGEAVAGIQHCWNVTNGSQCVVRGLRPGHQYTIYVVANYALANALQPTEIQAKSQVVKFITLGPPPPVKLSVVHADLNQVTFGWEPVKSTKDVAVTGYQVMVDDRAIGDVLANTITQTTIDNLSPGRSIEVSVITLTDHPIGNSDPSNKIRVTAPHKPPPPSLAQQPSYKKGTVIIAWEKPPGTESMPYGEDIVSYRVYVDGKWHGEIKATASGNRNGYQYYLNELQPGQTYDIVIKSYAGQRNLEANLNHMFCMVESDTSNTMPVMCPAPPKSPLLRVEGMHAEGLDVTWEMPQQYGDASVSGYQMLMNGKLYGSIIPPDVHSLRIKGLTLGDTVELQILALTDHPVGRGSDNENALSQSNDKALAELFSGDRYGACQPGPKLRVKFTGLVQAPAKVWSENVTGHSAVIVWSKEEKPRQHFIDAETYQVTWWPGEKPDADINSQSTKDDHLVIGGLRPNSQYTVIVEARRMIKYAEIDEKGAAPSHTDSYHNTCILTAQSEPLSVRTARPPSPPSNLGIVSTTCQSIQVSWDPPQENGVDIIGIRVDAVPMKQIGDEQLKHVCAETVPDAAGAIIDNLQEKTEYLITITALTEEYFEQLPPGHELKAKRVLSKEKIPPEDVWLPSASIMGMTSGTDGPTDLRVVKTSIDSVELKWNNPVVHGSNRYQGTVIRWAECKFTPRYSKHNDSQMAYHKTISAEYNQAVIGGLHPGVLYKFVVEAVVSVKTTLEQGHHNPEFERQNRRTTHVMSKPIFVRTRAPCEPPFPWVVGYTTDSVKLYWEKPIMYKCYGKDEEGYSKYLKLSLEGYRLEINGKPHMRLAPTAQSCTLIKCKPGKTYKVVLVALSCTEEVKKERRKAGQDPNTEVSFSLTEGANREWETTADDFENDESPAKPLHVTVPRLHDGFLNEKNAKYIFPKEKLDKSRKMSEGGDDDGKEDEGDICVNWKVHNSSEHIKQFNVCWKNLKSGDAQTKVVAAGSLSCMIPVNGRKALHDVVVETQYDNDVILPHVEHVQCLVPGSPDAPEIWLRSVDDHEFVIEWGEPRLYGNKCSGYQVYLNNKKAGSPLSAHHRKAIIPCKPRRNYKVNMVALSSDKRIPHSDMSNTLSVSTGSSPLHMNFVGYEEDLTAVGAEDNELGVKVVRVTEATIHLDWSEYCEMKEMGYYRVVWSSVPQPAEREVKLPAGEKSCVIHKCFPGTNHFVRVYAVGKKDQPLDRSRQLTVQTSAAPDPPSVSVRACNFRYIAIEWQKPKTYGDAGVTGYKVFVNGVVEATLSAEQCTYSYTGGKWCREYVFQVQALTASDNLYSCPSVPLVVTWPGVQPPLLIKAPSVSGNAVKVKWETPNSTDGIKIKQYKLVLLEEETKKPIQVISPIHPESTETEVHNLKAGNYMAYLEVHVHGSNDVVKSDLLHLEPKLTPDPPQIHVTVIGLDERRAIEKVTCDLLNKRDRLLNILASRDPNLSPRYQDDQPYTKATESLQHVDEMLDDCLIALGHYTGHVMAHVSWNCPQSNPDIMVTGYKVLVNGKQYGTTLHAGVKNIRIKLGMNQPCHKIAMVSVCDRPYSTSGESNVVELITEPFLPFGFYTFLNQRPKSAKTMGPAYQEALAIERKQGGRKLPINLGLLKRKVPPPSCALMDVFEGEYHPLFPPSGPRTLTAILFWSMWCYNSRKLLNWFVKFARMNNTQYDFIAVSCAPPNSSTTDRIDLVNTITANGWREDGSLRHVMAKSISKMAPSSPERIHDCFSHLRGPPLNAGTVGLDATGVKNEGVESSNVTELFGVSGVPTIILVHPQDYIAWKGRYAAADMSSFEHFMKYIIAQTMGQATPQPDPWDTNIDTETVDGAMKRRISESNILIHRPQIAGSTRTAFTNGTAIPTTIHLNGSARPLSAGRPLSAKKRQRFFTKTNKHQKGASADDKITVNNRPFSAPKFSPYAEKLVHPSSPQRRAKSGRKYKISTT